MIESTERESYPRARLFFACAAFMGGCGDPALPDTNASIVADPLSEAAVGLHQSPLLSVPAPPLKPAPRAGHSAIWDEQSGSILVFGGRVGSAQTRTNELWSLTKGSETWTWSLVTPSGTAPPVRYGHRAVFDADQRRMIVFGGIDGFDKKDTWLLARSGDGWAWTEIVPEGTLPNPRIWHSAVWDSARNRMIVFGGRTGGGTRYKDVWILAETLGVWSWTLITPTGEAPTARSGHAAAWDALGDQMLVFGGDDGTFDYTNEVWALRAEATGWSWIKLSPAGTKPTGRHLHMSAWDAEGRRLVVHGGSTGSNSDETWELRYSAGAWTWMQIAAQGTTLAGTEGCAAWLKESSEFVIFGGHAGSPDGFGTPTDQTHILNLSVSPLEWTSTEEEIPSPRSLFAAAWDPGRDTMLMFGGRDGIGDLGDTWSWTWVGDRWKWRPLPDSTADPAPRREHTAVWDAAGAQMIVFGGFRGETAVNLGEYFDETWVLRATTTGYSWTELDADWPWLPIPRAQHTAVWDPGGERMIVYGGARTDEAFTSDTWILAKTGASWTWTQLPVTFPRPISRAFHSAVWDPDGDRMIVFGGQSATSVNVNDVWELAPTGSTTWAWTELSPQGTPPVGRFRHSMVWDPVDRRALVFAGGSIGIGYLNDVWSLQETENGWTWTQLNPLGEPPPVLYQMRAVWDPVGRRMLVFGGRSNAYKNDTWSLTQVGPDTWRWSALSGWCETEPPVVSLVVPGDGTTVENDCRVEFTWADDQAKSGYTYVVEVDGKVAGRLQAEPGRATELEVHLPRGPHAWRIRTDGCVGVSTPSESRSFVLDAPAADARIAQVALVPRSDGLVDIVVDATPDDACGIEGVEIALDDGEWRPVAAVLAAALQWSDPVVAVSDGEHSLSVRTVDHVGNRSAARRYHFHVGPCWSLGICDEFTAECSTAAEVDAACDDRDLCTAGDRCDADALCVGSPADCDDENPCTTDNCAPVDGCAHTPRAGACDDGSACTIEDACDGDTCRGEVVDCDDVNECTVDRCDALLGCAHDAADRACDDGNACTVGDRCVDGACAGSGAVCDDQNPCTTDTCDPVAGCRFENHTLACDDADPCTTADQCRDGACQGVSFDCDDDDACTVDACEAGICGHARIPGCCVGDGDCLAGEACLGATCTSVVCMACDEDAECGSGGRCVRITTTSYCLVSCDADRLCPRDFECHEVEDAEVCVPIAGDCICTPLSAPTCLEASLVRVDTCGNVLETLSECGNGCAVVDGVEACCPAGTSVEDGECRGIAPDAEPEAPPEDTGDRVETWPESGAETTTSESEESGLASNNEGGCSSSTPSPWWLVLASLVVACWRVNARLASRSPGPGWRARTRSSSR